MKSLKLLFITACLLGSYPAIAQPSHFDTKRFIEWNEHLKLSWEYFESNVDDDIFGDAGTAVRIVAKPYLVGKRIEYNVYALFDRQKSWVFEKDSALLAHEQLHFDIAELYARKIRKRVDGLRKKNVKELSHYNKEINKLMAESNEMDDQYDMETLHGGIKAKQEEWNEKIASELSALEAYKKRKKIIGK